jgi:hypothetical protein
VHRLVKTSLVAGLTGALTVSAAWAGVGLVPVPTSSGDPVGNTVTPVLEQLAGSSSETEAASASSASAEVPKLGKGQLLVGAAKTDLTPRPEDMQDRFPGARWEQDITKCKILDPGFVAELAANTEEHVSHLAVAGSPWPENPNCLYMGGYGLGPMNPITSFDEENGLWVRAMAIGDGEDLTVLTVIDAEGWLWDYANKCTDCGIKQIADALAADPELADRGMTAGSFNLHATHSHTSMDFLGGWGFVPDWYMAQATDTIKQTVKDAVLSMEAAVLETGKADARRNNSERRDTYRSAEEPELTWMRAIAADSKPNDPEVIATLGAFAAHPVTAESDGGVAHADWPGYFAARAEERFGGVGLHFMTGLGNVTGARDPEFNEAGEKTRESTGTVLADLLPSVGGGRLVDQTGAERPDLRTARVTFQQPVTNAPLDALGTPGFFDRQFDPSPASVRTGKSPNEAPCLSAAPQSVELPVTAVKIGDDVVLTTGPGELFSNLTNTIKEKHPDQVVFPLAQTNDSLGYMPQSFELNPVGQQGLGFAIGGVLFVNYEDSYAIDRCVGDMVLETTLGLAGGL